MSIKWQRKSNISKEDYILNFQQNISPKQAAETDKITKAYEKAADICKFEIENFWKRAAYFWAFITSIYVAFFNVQKEFYYDKDFGFEHGAFPLLVLAALGFFFSLAWLCSTYASKFWQENWENHIDLLEDYVTGPLYKTYEAGKSFSVSKINIAASWVVSVCSGGFFVFEAVEFCRRLEVLPRIFAFVFILLVSVFGIFTFVMQIKGNAENNGKFSFDEKTYDGESI